MAVMGSLAAVTLDCPKPTDLANFYKEALGWQLIWSDENSAYLSPEDGSVRMGFQRVDGYRAPEWPKQDVPQQLHLDFSVQDLDAAEEALLKLGATRGETQAAPDRWRVLLDPVGHPFCITTAV